MMNLLSSFFRKEGRRARFLQCVTGEMMHGQGSFIVTPAAPPK